MSSRYKLPKHEQTKRGRHNSVTISALPHRSEVVVNIRLNWFDPRFGECWSSKIGEKAEFIKFDDVTLTALLEINVYNPIRSEPRLEHLWCNVEEMSAP